MILCGLHLSVIALMHICICSIFVLILGGQNMVLSDHILWIYLILHIIQHCIICYTINSSLRIVVMTVLRLELCITDNCAINLLRTYCCIVKCCVNSVIVLTLVVIYLMRYSSCCEYCSLWGRKTCIVWLRWIFNWEALEIVKGALEFL